MMKRTGARAVRRSAGILTAATMLTGGMIGFSTMTDPSPAQATPGLTSFSSCDALAGWYRDNLMSKVGAYGWDLGHGGGWRTWFGSDVQIASAASGAPVAAGAPAAEGDSAVGTGPTGTNVQEQGMDEPDRMKTDGQVMVTVNDAGALVVVDVTGSSPRPLGRVALPRGRSADLYGAPELLLTGDRVVVLQQTWEHRNSGIGGFGSTVVTAVDISRPSAPRTVSHQEITGQYVTARLHDSAVRLVLSSTPEPGFRTPGPSDGKVVQTDTKRANRAVLRRARGEQLVPQYVSRNASGAVVKHEPAVPCTAMTRPAEASGWNMTTVFTLNPATGQVVHGSGVVAEAETVYASRDRLYVATNRWWDLKDRAALNDPSTQLHSFDISSPSLTRYRGSGDVPGWLLNQWSLSERDGVLRVATTRRVGASTDNAIVTLADAGGKLTRLGQVTGLGRTETVRGVRWFEDMVALVTFRQTDPLYLVDLADPRSPRAMGELKVPGYSAYLHPIGQQRLLGIGQDATTQGRLLGTQVATFDIANPAAPKRLSLLTQRGTNSAVEFDSRQFAYLPARGIALLPVTRDHILTGLRAIRVSDDGTLAQVGSYSPGTVSSTELVAPDEVRGVVRAIPAGDRVVALVEGTDGGLRAVLLGLDGLVPSDSVAL